MTCINHAVGSSTVRAWDKNHSWQSVPWQNIAYSLSMTLAEKEDLIKNWATYRTQFILNPPETLSEDTKNYIRSTSYEENLLPYLDGRKPAPGYIVLSHGYNDWFRSESQQEFIALPNNLRSRDTYLGSMNFIIDLILKYQPDMPIILEGHYENQLNGYVVQAQQTLTEYRKIPLLKLWEKIDWTQQRVVDTQKLWSVDPWKSYTIGAQTNLDMTKLRVALPDQVHPHSDPTGKAAKIMADAEMSCMQAAGIPSLRNLIISH